MIYFDNAATTMIKPLSVTNAVTESFEKYASVGRSAYEAAMSAGEMVFECREKIAKMFGTTEPENIIFTHNATYALNMAIKGVQKNKRGEVLVSGYEHNSVMRPLKSLERQGVFTNIARGILFNQQNNVERFKKSITKYTRLCVVNHVSNVFGFIQDIYSIDELCFRKGIPMILDCSQSAGIIQIDLKKLKSVVAICMPGHKGLLGPQGTGIMILTDKVSFHSLIEGGTGSVSSEDIQPEFSPDKYESGTCNVHGISGLLEGVKYIENMGISNIRRHEFELLCHAVDIIKRIEGSKVFYSLDENIQSGVLSFINENFKCETLSELFGKEDVCVRAGLHCSPNAHKSAMTYATGTVRLSFSIYNTHEEIEKFGKIYENIVLRKNKFYNN